MEQSNSPGPGRSTADKAFSEVKKQVALRNEEAHKAAQKLRAARDKEQLSRRRELDRL
jgi:hypothetical protein